MNQSTYLFPLYFDRFYINIAWSGNDNGDEYVWTWYNWALSFPWFCCTMDGIRIRQRCPCMCWGVLCLLLQVAVIVAPIFIFGLLQWRKSWSIRLESSWQRLLILYLIYPIWHGEAQNGIGINILARKLWQRRSGVVQTRSRLATELISLTARGLEAGESDTHHKLSNSSQTTRTRQSRRQTSLGSTRHDAGWIASTEKPNKR